MSVLSSDTHPKMEALQIQFWRQASPTRKMHVLAQFNASARMLALAGLILGEEPASKVHGELPDSERTD